MSTTAKLDEESIKLNQMAAKAVWLADYKSKNPGASKEERAAAWAQAAHQFRKAFRSGMNKLKKDGISLTKA